jgi:nucleoside-diphosphate-sugar epimerase
MNIQSRNSVLVTGAGGFIGRAARKLLHRSGYSVLSLDQPPPAKSGASQWSIGRQVLLDITDAEQLQRLFEARKIEAIIHLAAILPTAAQQEPARATEVNIQGSLNLVEMARKFGVRRFVFGSSLSVYGTCPAEQVVAESYRAAPEDLYGAAKLYVEHLGEAYRHHHGLEFISLRIGRVVGPGAKSASSAWRSQIFEFLGASGPVEIALPYVACERLLMVHVDDVAKMLVTLAEAKQPEHSLYNAVCESVIVDELKREIQALNSNIRVKLGVVYAMGNPRLLDYSRFQREFGYQTAPIFEQLKKNAGGDTH